MDNKKLNRIVTSIEQAFVNEKEYELRKSVEEIHNESNSFLGDFVSFLMVDKKASPPVFYSVISPFDLVSKKAPQQALVWQDGNLLLNEDYTDYAAMRTGAMDSIALKICNVNSLQNMKVLIFGTGQTARWSVKVMKAVFTDLEIIHYINSTNTKAEDFEKFTSDMGVKAIVGSKNDLKEYDVIICHTSAEEPVLGSEEIQTIKNGAIITTFLGSEKIHGEVTDDYYNENANIVLDWDKNFELAKDIVRSGTPKDNIILLADLLSNKISLDKNKKYTIFRFVGTPMQNLGVLQELSIDK